MIVKTMSDRTLLEPLVQLPHRSGVGVDQVEFPEYFGKCQSIASAANTHHPLHVDAGEVG